MKILRGLGLLVCGVIVVLAVWIHSNYEGGVPAFVDDLISQDGPDVNKLEQQIELDLDA